MSDTSSLSQLARFIGHSTLSSSDPAEYRRAIDAITGNLAPRLQRRSVGELLGVVLALSARTRRMVMPQTAIDIDVFAPDGRRAVKLVMAHRS
jgi:hypothetical protein